MKRPLFTVGFIYLTAMTVAFYVNYVASIAVLFILCFAGLMLIGDKSKFGKIALTVLTTGMAALAVSVCFTVFRYAAVSSLDGKSMLLEGTIISERHHDRIHNYEVKVSIDGIAILGSNDVRINLTTFERLDAEAGDSIIARFNMSSLDEISDGNNMYYLSKGILGAATLGGEVSLLDEPTNKLLSLAVKTRTALINVVSENVGNDRGGLVSALLFGDGEEIEDGIRQSFNHSGISHILAISGLHLAIVVHIASGFLIAIFGKRRASLASIMCIWIFVFMGGAGYSLVRSGIMFTVYFLGELIGRESDGLNSLGLAAIVITSINPYAIGNLSMQLSFLATFGILILGPIIEKGIMKNIINERFRNNGTLRTVIKIFAITVAAQIPVAPIITLKFGFISLISPLTNMLVSPIVPVLLFTGIITAFGGAMGFAMIAKTLGDITTLLVEIIINISDFLSSVPFASVYVAKSYIAIWFFFVAVAAVWVYMTKHPGKAKAYLVIAATFTLLVGATSEEIFELNTVKVLNTEGSRSVAVVKSNRAVIIGVPESRQMATQILNRLEGYGVKGIDLVVASSNEEIMTAGAEYLFSTRKVSYVVAPDDEYTKEYLGIITSAKLLPLKNMEINMLDGVRGSLVENWGINIEVNHNSILKIFEDYDIMKSKNSEALAVIDASGVPYMKKRGNGVRYIAHFGGSGEFMLR